MSVIGVDPHPVMVDVRRSMTYMDCVSRFFLLLSVLLTALTGVVAGTPVTAQPVVASAAAMPVKSGPTANVAASLPRHVQGAFAAAATWRAPAPSSARSSPHSFGERRRE